MDITHEYLVGHLPCILLTEVYARCTLIKWQHVHNFHHICEIPNFPVDLTPEQSLLQTIDILVKIIELLLVSCLS